MRICFVTWLMVWVWCLRPPTVCSWRLCKVTLRRACGTEVGSMLSLLSFVLLVLERRIQESPSRRILLCSMIKTLIWSREWRGISFQVVALQSQNKRPNSKCQGNNIVYTPAFQGAELYTGLHAGGSLLTRLYSLLHCWQVSFWHHA